MDDPWATEISVADRIRQNIVIEASGCWEWTGSRFDWGYGKISVHGATVGAHRASWEASHGPVPDGLWVLHKCDNPPCCNPEHLFLGTTRDNTADRHCKGRSACGERTALAKLTADKVTRLRAAYATGATQVSLANQYGITQASVSAVVLGKTWKHL